MSLTYPHSNKVALSQISYTFPTGTTAIVGPNGAGKSTLVKLLTGLLQPTSGSISVQLPDGAVLSPAELHKSVLFQEPSHLYLTIRQNITMRFASTLDDDESIYEALETAGLGRLVGELPDGIDTLVGAGFGGRLDLSGGQWQRLALARLIYQDAPVMILDEPVASLDPEGERAVFELFSHLTRDKIIIFTTHRYDSIPEDTTIVVLADGRITETGTHDDLLRQQREYWSLYVSSSQKVRNAETAGDHRQAGVRRLGCKSIRRQQRSGARADDAVDAANVGGAVETRSRATAGQVRRSLGVVVGVAALVLAAAVLVGAMAVRHGVGGTPNAVATPATAPQLVSEQPAPAPTPRPAVIEPAVRVGWQAWPDDPRSGAWPGADGYHLVVRQPDQFIAVDAPLTPPVRDVILRATFRKVGGPPGGGYGVIVRDDDSGQPDGQSRAGGFYLLEANDTGAVGIWRRDGVNWRDLLPWTSTTAVRPGQAINQLEVQASGPLLTLRINGITVASWSEASGEPGRVGVFVGGGVGTDVRLDDFSVQVPK